MPTPFAINVPININLPSDARERDLYTSMNAHQLIEAVAQMNLAMVAACSALAQAALEGENVPTADKVYERFVYPTLVKFSHLGACDTEPRVIALVLLDEFRSRVV
jgi:hypothetical protein